MVRLCSFIGELTEKMWNPVRDAVFGIAASVQLPTGEGWTASQNIRVKHKIQRYVFLFRSLCHKQELEENTCELNKHTTSQETAATSQARTRNVERGTWSGGLDCNAARTNASQRRQRGEREKIEDAAGTTCKRICGNCTAVARSTSAHESLRPKSVPPSQEGRIIEASVRVHGVIDDALQNAWGATGMNQLRKVR